MKKYQMCHVLRYLITCFTHIRSTVLRIKTKVTETAFVDNNTPYATVEWFSLLLRIPEIPDLNLGPLTGYRD
jgi:hypothetical protein